MKNHMQTSPESVAEAHRNSNLVILRFNPPAQLKHTPRTTSFLGMSVIIYRIGDSAAAQT